MSRLHKSDAILPHPSPGFPRLTNRVGNPTRNRTPPPPWGGGGGGGGGKEIMIDE